MNEEQQTGTDPEDARVRALLADLGSGSTGAATPDEVVARLDETLARLVAERAAETGGLDEPAEFPESAGNVVPLRRRWASRATIAAAAVVVLGVGGAAVGNLAGIGSMSDSKTASDAGGAAAGESLGEVPPSASGPLPSPTDGQLDVAPGAAAGLAVVHAEAFAQDVSALLSGGDALSTPERRARAGLPSTSDDAKAGPGDALRELADCPGPPFDDGAVTNVVQYDGSIAALVVHPVSGGQRLVEAWTCQGDTRLASATVAP